MESISRLLRICCGISGSSGIGFGRIRRINKETASAYDCEFFARDGRRNLQIADAVNVVN
jgi:hypothetical protein